MSAIRAIAKALKRNHVLSRQYSLLHASSMTRISPVSSSMLAYFSPEHQASTLLSKSTRRSSYFFALQYHCSFPSTTPFKFPERRTLGSTELLLVDVIRRVAGFESEAEAMSSLDKYTCELTPDIVFLLIWGLREEWRLAFLAFKWGERCSIRDSKACDLMVWVLGTHRKFNTAWCLIRDMHLSSVDTRKAMLTMIDRYAAANDPNKAIRTFQVMDKFRLSPDEEAFHSLLHALCVNRNIEEAEEFMLVNKKLFPPSIEGFNIILNGWCNVMVDVSEAKRIWRKMSEYCILPNAVSYKHMISCFSKVGNLFDSLRLFDEMKKRGFIPGLQVYNSLFYVLTLESCFSEALTLLEKMREQGLHPTTETYNSMIHPLCEAKKHREAKDLLADMIREKLDPTVETFHAFLKVVSFEETLEVLERMKISGLGPKGETFLLMLEKFVNAKQPEYALRIWSELESSGVSVDSRHYSTLVHGLVTCGRLGKAKEVYSEMKSKGFLGDPKLEKLLYQPERRKIDNKSQNQRPLLRRKQINPWKGSSRKPNKCPEESQNNGNLNRHMT